MTSRFGHEARQDLEERLFGRFEKLGARLRQLYPDSGDVTLDRIADILRRAHAGRPPDLLALDQRRIADPHWHLRADRIGYSAYVDRFAGTLSGVEQRLPHLLKLGVTYLHLLPFLKSRPGADDGGFAVSDFGTVDPRYGDWADLESLAARLREAGVSLCADFVLNHTADDHPWAIAARTGDPKYRAYYHIMANQAEAAAYEANLKQVFPESAPGNFTRVDDLDGWVWTTFYPFQWDLNFFNPDVLCEMISAMLNLANAGVEVLRLDSIPFVWKRQGTDCRNLPEAHVVLQVFRLAAEIAAPALVLKSEAVVETPDAAAYLGSPTQEVAEAHLAYNNSLMVHLWAALAEASGDPIRDVLAQSPPTPAGAGWINYIRCHDDIGWSVLTNAAGASDPARNLALCAFYAGELPGAFSSGLRFQASAKNAAPATCGMLASLAGLESAGNDPQRTRLAIARIRLLHGLIVGLPGLPVIYMGDEIGLTNDWRYAERDRFFEDARGLHRPAMTWDLIDARQNATNASALILSDLMHLLQVRRSSPALASNATCRSVPLREARLFCAERSGGEDSILVIANLSPDTIELDLLEPAMGKIWTRDRLAPQTTAIQKATLVLAPYALHWLEGDD